MCPNPATEPWKNARGQTEWACPRHVELFRQAAKHFTFWGRAKWLWASLSVATKVVLVLVVVYLVVSLIALSASGR